MGFLFYHIKFNSMVIIMQKFQDGNVASTIESVVVLLSVGEAR
jgi:hypothetical protein